MGWKNRLYVQLKALACLFWGSLFVQDLVEVDFQEELSRNKQLACSEESKKNEHRRKLRECTMERRANLRRQLGRSFVWILSACLVGFLVAAFGWAVCLSQFMRPRTVLAFASIFLFAWATLGRLGWASQSWSGDTVFEQLDKLIFRCLYWIGTLFGALAFLT